MTFEHSGWLAALLLLLPLLLLEWRSVVRAGGAVKQLLGREPLPALIAQLRPGRGTRERLLRYGALALLAIGAAGPQWGREAVRRQSQGSDLAFVLDVSASMQARDVPPSRLEESRREAVALLDHLQGCRVGVVAFAGDAVRLCPLTLDQAAVRLTLETIEPGAISEPGTDLGRALRMAQKLLPAGRRDEQAIVLWTDGEDLEGHARDAIEDLRRDGLRVFVVGVGTPAGDVIPLADISGVTVDVKRDDQGNVVRSRLDEPLLRELARSTRGNYFAAARSGGELVRLAASLGGLARSRRGTRLVERPVARFPLCALLAAGLLTAYFALPRRRLPGAARADAVADTPRRRKPGRARSGGRVAAGLLLVLGLAAGAPGARAQSDWARGDRAFRKGDWAGAESLYARRAARGRVPAGLLTNLATARANRAPADTLAEKTLGQVAKRDDAAGTMASYNLGTLLGRRGSLDEALADLRRALEKKPDDADARWNYEYLRRMQDAARKQPRPQPGRQPQNPTPQPQSQPQPQPQAGQGQPQPQQPQPGSQSQSQSMQTPPAPGMQQPMTREQADRLLGSLGDLERLERQNRKRGEMQREKKGKDW